MKIASTKWRQLKVRSVARDIQLEFPKVPRPTPSGKCCRGKNREKIREREADRKEEYLKKKKIWLRSTMPQLMAKSESPVGLLGSFDWKLSSKTYAQFARKRTEDKPRYTHTYTRRYTQEEDTHMQRHKKTSSLPENTFAFPFSFSEWKPRTKWPSCASLVSLSPLSQLPVRSLARTADTHTRTHMYVCCIYWIKKQNLVKDKARSAAENSWATVWTSCCRCCCFYCYCCCCCCYRSLYVHRLLLLLLQS